MPPGAKALRPESLSERGGINFHHSGNEGGSMKVIVERDADPDMIDWTDDEVIAYFRSDPGEFFDAACWKVVRESKP